MDLLSLWLPILLSAVAVWFVSTLFGMPFLHHRDDWVGLPADREDAFMEAVRRIGIGPGNYLVPDFRTRAAMESETVKRAIEQGPIGHLSLWPTPLSMGGKMLGTLLVYGAASIVIGYLASLTLPRGAEFGRVFQTVGVAGVLAYCFAFLPSGIWFGAYKRTLIFSIIDGVVYAAITGAIFAWRWPG